MAGVLVCISVGCFCAVLVYGLLLNAHSAHSLRIVKRLRIRARDGRPKSTRTYVSTIERHVPELAETIALGIRAGLSFDKSFRLYCERFDDELSRLCLQAIRGWEGGFMTREEALSSLAKESGSEIVQRLVVNINRSLSLGTSLARTLEILASESRSCHKAKIEEKIARVPVKMMIPTAVCILPSMLIVILGPVVLGMM